MSKLHYLFRKTDRTKPSQATLVVMHGYGANEFDLLGIADYFKEPLTVLSFRAPLPLEWGGHAWYHLSQDEHGALIADDESRKQSEEQVLNALPDILKETESDANNIYLMGFSQGAAMCYSLLGRHDLSQHGLKVNGVIGMSGYIPHDVMLDIESRRFDGLEMFMSHGDEDILVPAKGLTVAKETFTRLGAKVEGKIYTGMGHSISDEVLADLTAWLTSRLSAKKI
jgi:phospholipase/carboxylesterase